MVAQKLLLQTYLAEYAEPMSGISAEVEKCVKD